MYIIFTLLFIIILLILKVNKIGFSSTKNKTALIFHVGNINVFQEIFNEYPRFFKSDIDKYITVNNETDKNAVLENSILKCNVFVVPNKGMDIGPFLNVVKHMKLRKLEYDYFVKIHTKTDKKWRDDMFLPMYTNVDKIINGEYINKPTIYGAKNYTFKHMPYNNEHISDIIERNYSKYHNLKSTDNLNRCTDNKFLAGTCFIFNKKYFKKLLKIKDFDYEINILEEGLIKNHKYTIPGNEEITYDQEVPGSIPIFVSRATHAWEYFFGKLTCFYNTEIIELI